MHAPAAFRQQLLAAIPRLRRYGRSLVFDAGAADDLVQTALERALTHWHQFDQRRDILVWPISIAHNAHIDERRRNARLSLVEPADGEAPPHAHLDRWGGDPGADVGLRIDLIAALQSLPLEQREALAAGRRRAVQLRRMRRGAGDPDRHRDVARFARARRAARAARRPGPRFRCRRTHVAPRDLTLPWTPTTPPCTPGSTANCRPAGRRRRGPAARGPERAAKVRLWRADRDALRAQFDALLHEPRTGAARAGRVAGAGEAARGRMGGRRGAGFVLGGATGAGLLANLEAPQRALQADSGEWLQRAAVAHAVYVPEKRHPVEVSVEQNQDGHLARWLTKRLDVPVKLFDLNPQGFELVGGRLLPDERGPSAQLMYQNASGQRVTVYLRKPDTGPADAATAAFRYERQGELGLFYWVEGQGAAATGYALVGSLPREQLLALAEAIYRQGGAGTQARPP